jgi:HAD superfamily hydrolase (TIGR01458 family)
LDVSSDPHEPLAVSGVLLDVDGVLRVDDQIIPGAIEAVRHLRDRGFGVRFLTNTSVRSRASLWTNLVGLGLPIDESELFTAPVATAAYLRETGKKRIFLLVKGDVVDDFADFERGDSAVDAVVIGGAEEQFTYKNLNLAFRLILDGAELVAIHRNTSWRTGRGLQLDAGAFVAGLELAAGVAAKVLGKPSPAFFRLATTDLGIPVSAALVVGDDAQSDIAGGQAAGARTALVRTGKFRPPDLATLSRPPDLMLDSIADLPASIRSMSLDEPVE